MARSDIEGAHPQPVGRVEEASTGAMRCVSLAAVRSTSRSPSPMQFRLILNAALALSAPVMASGQVGSTTDILMGKVSGVDSQAVVGARIEATSMETGITRTKTTDAEGRYTIVFPDG